MSPQADEGVWRQVVFVCDSDNKDLSGITFAANRTWKPAKYLPQILALKTSVDDANNNHIALRKRYYAFKLRKPDASPLHLAPRPLDVSLQLPLGVIWNIEQRKTQANRGRTRLGLEQRDRLLDAPCELTVRTHSRTAMYVAAKPLIYGL